MAANAGADVGPDTGPDVVVRSHPAVRTLLLTRDGLSAWLLDERSGDARQLNDSAAAVWALMEAPLTVEALTADLCDTFGTDPETAAGVVSAALDVFVEADLVVTGPADETRTPDETRSVEAHEPTDAPDGPEGPDVEEPRNLARPPDP